jgi:hypothetical protein
MTYARQKCEISVTRPLTDGFALRLLAAAAGTAASRTSCYFSKDR